MPGDPIQVIEQQPLPAADNRIWIVKNESETYGLQGFAFNGPYIEVYNGPALPVWRWGGERPGQLSKLFGNDYEWLASDPATAGAKWTTEVAD
jgi:hypothetical protein